MESRQGKTTAYHATCRELFGLLRCQVRARPMRTIKRALVFTCEIGVLILGIGASFALAGFANQINSFEPGVAPLVILLSGLPLTFVGFLLIRRRTQIWKTSYEVVSFELSRAERNLDPVRAKRKRMLQ